MYNLVTSLTRIISQTGPARWVCLGEMSVSRSKSKEKQGLTLDVSFSEVSVLQRCLFKLKTCLSYRGVHFRVFIKHMTKLPNKVSLISFFISFILLLINNKRGSKLRTHSGFQKDWYVNHRGAVYPTRIQTRKGGGGGGKLLPNILLNEIDILTTCKVIIKGLVSRLIV